MDNKKRGSFAMRRLGILVYTIVFGLFLSHNHLFSQDTIQERPYMLARDLELESLLNKAIELISIGKEQHGLSLIKKILKEKPNEVVIPVDLDRSEGLIERLKKALKALPKEKKEKIEKILTKTANPILQRAIKSNDKYLLEWVADHYPVTKFSINALKTLGRIELERGRIENALSWFRRSLDEYPSDNIALSGYLECKALLGEKYHIPKSYDGLFLFEGKVFDQKTFLDKLSSIFGILKSEVAFPAFGGKYYITSSIPSRLSLTWEQKIPLMESEPLGFPVYPVCDDNKLYICAGKTALCIEFISGKTIWRYKASTLINPKSTRKIFSGFSKYLRNKLQVDGLVLSGALSSKLFICPLVVGRTGADASFQSIQISASIPIRRLYAFNKETGKLIWTHAPESARGLLNLTKSWNVAGPPVIVGENVYVPLVEYGQTVSSYIGCFSAKNGKALWITRICSGQIQLNMFGNVTTEYVASPIAIKDGIIYGSTNLGVVYAVEASNGQVKWLAFYESARPPDKRWTEEYMRNTVQRFHLGPNIPLVLDDQVVFGPLDSKRFFAVSKNTGKLLWKFEGRQIINATPIMVNYILGYIKGKIILQGNSIVSIDPRYRRGRRISNRGIKVLVAPSRLSTKSFLWRIHPRGAITSNSIITNTLSSVIKVWDLYGHNKRTYFSGYQKGAHTLYPQKWLGNVLPANGGLIICGNTYISAYLNIKGIISALEKRIEEEGRLPSLLHTYALLLLKDNRSDNIDKAITILKEAYNNPNSPNYIREKIKTTLINTLISYINIQKARGNLDKALESSRFAYSISEGTDFYLDVSILFLDILEATKNYKEWKKLVLKTAERFWTNTYYFSNVYTVFPEILTKPITPYEKTQVGPFLIAKLAKEEEKHGNPKAAISLWWRIFSKTRNARIKNIALSKMNDLIKRYGRSVYSDIESDAQNLLAEGIKKKDISILRRVIKDYPLSNAAKKALKKLVEITALSMDIPGFLEAFREIKGDRESDWFLRRMAEAAKNKGNDWLAWELLKRLASKYGNKKSTLVSDSGKTYAEIVKNIKLNHPLPILPHLKKPPIKRALIKMHINYLSYSKLLIPIIFRKQKYASPLPIFLMSSNWMCALKPIIKGKSILPKMWSVHFTYPGAQNPRAFVIGDFIYFSSRRSLYKVHIQTGKAETLYSWSASYYNIFLTIRHGLLVAVLERLGYEERKVVVIEPFSGALWGERTIATSNSLLTVPSPKGLLFLYINPNNKGIVSRVNLSIFSFDPIYMKYEPVNPNKGQTIIPLKPPLGDSDVVCGKEHIILPVITEEGTGIRAIPISNGALEWEIELPKKEKVTSIYLIENRVFLIGIDLEKSVLRIIDEKTGKEIKRLTLKSQPYLAKIPGRDDPWVGVKQKYTFFVAGSKSTIRHLYIINNETLDIFSVMLTGKGFVTTYPYPLPITGNKFAAVILRIIPQWGANIGPSVFIINLRNGTIIRKIPGLVSVGGSYPQLYATSNILFVVSGNTIGALIPEEEK